MPLHLIEDLTDDQGEPVRIIALNGVVTIETGDPEHPTRLELDGIEDLARVAEVCARAAAHQAWEISEARRCGKDTPRTSPGDLDRLGNAAGLLSATAEYLRTPSSEFARR
jgi:hypothetical protein